MAKKVYYQGLYTHSLEESSSLPAPWYCSCSACNSLIMQVEVVLVLPETLGDSCLAPVAGVIRDPTFPCKQLALFNNCLLICHQLRDCSWVFGRHHCYQGGTTLPPRVRCWSRDFFWTSFIPDFALSPGDAIFWDQACHFYIIELQNSVYELLRQECCEVAGII